VVWAIGSPSKLREAASTKERRASSLRFSAADLARDFHSWAGWRKEAVVNNLVVGWGKKHKTKIDKYKT
jgi:hypothetical protein